MSGTSTNRAKKLFAKRKEKGLCPTCGGGRTDHKLLQCAACRVKQIQRISALQKRQRQERKSEGTCRKCGEPVVGKVLLCEHHWLQDMAQQSMGSTRFAKLLLEKLTSQERRCYYTGGILVAGEASIDHLFPTSRYPELRAEPSNVVWCSKEINLMKNGMTDSEFIGWCKVIGARFGM